MEGIRWRAGSLPFARRIGGTRRDKNKIWKGGSFLSLDESVDRRGPQRGSRVGVASRSLGGGGGTRRDKNKIWNRYEGKSGS